MEKAWDLTFLLLKGQKLEVLLRFRAFRGLQSQLITRVTHLSQDTGQTPMFKIATTVREATNQSLGLLKGTTDQLELDLVQPLELSASQVG